MVAHSHVVPVGANGPGIKGRHWVAELQGIRMVGAQARALVWSGHTAEAAVADSVGHPSKADHELSRGLALGAPAVQQAAVRAADVGDRRHVAHPDSELVGGVVGGPAGSAGRRSGEGDALHLIRPAKVNTQPGLALQ